MEAAVSAGLQDAGAGGARPAAGPAELPISQQALDPGYAAGSGQRTDPLSCLWVDPATGTLHIKCFVNIQPAPFAAAAPPPPSYDAWRFALIVAAAGGSGGLGVRERGPAEKAGCPAS